MTRTKALAALCGRSLRTAGSILMPAPHGRCAGCGAPLDGPSALRPDQLCPKCQPVETESASCETCRAGVMALERRILQEGFEWPSVGLKKLWWLLYKQVLASGK